MKVLLFGTTGMVGQGVLRECLLDPDVETVLSVGRKRTRRADPKLRDVVLSDPGDISSLTAELPSIDACFFCLGISSFRMSETEYRRITYDLTLRAAKTLVAANPRMTFIYVSGSGTDSSERGSSMWARVKGETENALFKLGFERAVMFRPGAIQPLHGIESKTALYRWSYIGLAPLIFLMKTFSPSSVTTTEEVGRAMLAVAKRGSPKPIVENREIRELGKPPGA